MPWALAFVVLSLLLLVLIGQQTQWVAKTKLYAQPRFWPAVALVGMAAFAALHLWRLHRRRSTAEDWREARTWLRPFEFALWFMAYVWAVPIVGFLPASLIFAPALSWRMGYRGPRMLWTAAAFGAAVVVVFKSLLAVKIPGGLVYELLPGALRSFFIVNL